MSPGDRTGETLRGCRDNRSLADAFYLLIERINKKRGRTSSMVNETWIKQKIIQLETDSSNGQWTEIRE
jgi:hypothetical protein